MREGGGVSGVRGRGGRARAMGMGDMIERMGGNLRQRSGRGAGIDQGRGGREGSLEDVFW